MLGLLDASDLLQYVKHNFCPYHCLVGLTSGGFQRLKKHRGGISSDLGS
jgi:hypothetical protein